MFKKIDIYIDQKCQFAFERNEPLAHHTKFHEWTLSIGPIRISKISPQAMEILDDDEN